MLFLGCKNLIRLEFDNNQLLVIPPGVFNQCPSLKYIYFNNNQISILPDGLFDKCIVLEEINFSDNQLSRIPDNLFDKFSSLKFINFNNNQLSTIPERLFDNCPALKEIRCSNNQLSKLPDSLFEKCCALQFIDFSYNRIETFQIPDIQNAEYFYLQVIHFNNNQLATLQDQLFDKCPALKKIYFNDNQLSSIPNGLLHNCSKLQAIDCSNNRLSTIPTGLFDNCAALEWINFNNNQLLTIPDKLFDNCRALEEIRCSNNQLSKIPDRLLDECSALIRIDFSGNQLTIIPDCLFDKCAKLKWIYFNKNEISTIQKNLFFKCIALKVIYFSDNHLTKIPDCLFDKCSKLQKIYFNNNQLSKIPNVLFDNCPDLEGIGFRNNQISKIPERLLDKCHNLKGIRFSNNQLFKIPDRLFSNCHLLEHIDFSDNRIITFHDNLLIGCSKVRSFYLEKNNIVAVSFRSLEPLSPSDCIDINLTDNFLYNSKSLYSLMFQQRFNEDLQEVSKSYFEIYRNFDFSVSKHKSTKYFIIRIFDTNLVENFFLAFYLSSSSKASKSIKSLQSKFNLYCNKIKYSILSEFSLLDLFVSIFGEIDDSKIINLKKHIDQLIQKDDKLTNIEFLIRSEKTIRHLCERNISSHFDAFFPNTFYELISRVRKTKSKTVGFKSDEEVVFNAFCKYIAIKKNPNEILFHLIEYTECFNIALRNKNCEIAKFIVILLRYYVMVWSDFKNVAWTQKEYLTDYERVECSKKAQEALDKFNRNLFLQFEYIFENDLGEIVTFLLDIKKLDQLKLEKSKRGFLEYDINRYNSKQTDPACRVNKTKDGQKKKEFLQFANHDILKHESFKQIFTEKWREKAAIKYYFDLIMFIIFVVFYTIYIESIVKIDVDAILVNKPANATQLSAWWFSLVLAVINFILEVLQCWMYIINKKFTKYINRYVIQIKPLRFGWFHFRGFIKSCFRSAKVYLHQPILLSLICLFN